MNKKDLKALSKLGPKTKKEEISPNPPCYGNRDSDSEKCKECADDVVNWCIIATAPKGMFKPDWLPESW